MEKRIAIGSKLLGVKNVCWNILICALGIAICVVNVFFVLTVKLTVTETANTLRFSANIVCTLLQFVLLFTFVRQPMDEISQSKVEILQNKPDDADLEKVKDALFVRLNNIQNYPLAEFLKVFLRNFIRIKTVGLEKVEETSVCFVANHYEIYGPLATELQLRKSLRPWTEGAIVDKKTLVKQLRSGIEIITRKWLIKPIRRKIPELIARPMWKGVKWARAIAIHRFNAEKIAAMFEESVQALQEGDNVLVFPESVQAGDNYKLGDVDPFHTGFCEIATHYKRATGKDLAFYPIYVDKVGKQMIVGDKVVFDPLADPRQEKQRIAETLYTHMMEMCNACKAQRKNKKH